MRVVQSEKTQERALDRLAILRLNCSRHLPRVARKTLVDDLLEFEAARRIYRLLALEEVRRQLVGLQDSRNPLVPLCEELRVLALLHHERAEVHQPIEATKGPCRFEHRNQVLRHRLFAGEEPDRESEQRFSSLLRNPRPILDIPGVIKLSWIPDRVDRLLVFPIDIPAHHLAREMEFLEVVGLFRPGGRYLSHRISLASPKRAPIIRSAGPSPDVRATPDVRPVRG